MYIVNCYCVQNANKNVHISFFFSFRKEKWWENSNKNLHSRCGQLINDKKKERKTMAKMSPNDRWIVNKGTTYECNDTEHSINQSQFFSVFISSLYIHKCILFFVLFCLHAHSFSLSIACKKQNKHWNETDKKNALKVQKKNSVMKSFVIFIHFF